MTISLAQLFAMIMLFEFGTALVVPIGLTAEQGVWLSILIALPGGLLLYGVYMYLFREYPQLILSGYMRKIVGPFLAFPISYLFILSFMYIAARNLREAGDLLITTSYDQTPLFVIHAVFAVPVIYVLSKGVEVFFRLGEIYILVMLSLGAIGYCAALFSGEINMSNLLPIYGEGWGSILQAAYPKILAFPFAELATFTVILPLLNNKRKAAKVGSAAIMASGILLSMTHALNIAVLGADIYGRASFPLFTTVSVVHIGEFLQRLDAIVMLTLIIGVFFKMTLYCYAASALVGDLFKVSDVRKLSYPIVTVVLFMSVLSAWSYPEHAEEGEISLYIILILFAAVPIVLAAVHRVRKTLQPKG
ncbi:spore gernimation protein GerB [Xylanibacillus composti]|nr:spore gernimation protein GerB [Xylanibacillus composti]